MDLALDKKKQNQKISLRAWPKVNASLLPVHSSTDDAQLFIIFLLFFNGIHRSLRSVTKR